LQNMEVNGNIDSNKEKEEKPGKDIAYVRRRL
jgi:hypothetical protein